MTTVAASTTANQAYLSINLKMSRIYWAENYINGIANIDVDDLINLDEMGLSLESQNRKIGKTVRGARADQKGQYNRGVKMNF